MKLSNVSNAVRKFRKNEVAMTITAVILFWLIGFVAELALWVATVQFWGTGLFMAHLYWLRKIIYVYLAGAHVWTIKEFFVLPARKLLNMF